MAISIRAGITYLKPNGLTTALTLIVIAIGVEPKTIDILVHQSLHIELVIRIAWGPIITNKLNAICLR